MDRIIRKHHQETIEIITDYFKKEGNIQGLIIGGSIAHGFATEKSDVDIFLVISDEEYQERLQKGELTYWNDQFATYEGGYIDGKYISTSFLKKVAEKGSEPARFAFKDAFIIFSRINELDILLKEASKYPLAEKESKIKKFYAQFEAWK